MKCWSQAWGEAEIRLLGKVLALPEANRGSWALFAGRTALSQKRGFKGRTVHASNVLGLDAKKRLFIPAHLQTTFVLLVFYWVGGKLWGIKDQKKP